MEKENELGITCAKESTKTSKGNNLANFVKHNNVSLVVSFEIHATVNISRSIIFLLRTLYTQTKIKKKIFIINYINSKSTFSKS